MLFVVQPVDAVLSCKDTLHPLSTKTESEHAAVYVFKTGIANPFANAICDVIAHVCIVSNVAGFICSRLYAESSDFEYARVKIITFCMDITHE